MELEDDEDCGCGSGLAYSNCCKSEHLKFLRNDRGQLVKQVIPLEGFSDIVLEQEAYIKRVFGRKPRGSDRFVLDQYLVRQSEFSRGFEEAARIADINPALVYGYRKTGLIPTERNSHLLTTTDWWEWEEAIEEYKAALESGIDLLQDTAPSVLEALRALAELAHDSCIHFGSYLTRVRRARRMQVHEFVQTAALTRVHELAISLYNLLKEEGREETFIVIRAILECYHIIVCLEQIPEQALALFARYSLGNGDYRYAVGERGGIDRRTIVSERTGEKFKVRSTRWMAAQSPLSVDLEIYDSIYESLSQHVHFDLSNMERYFSFEEGFQIPPETDLVQALVVSFCVLKMMCDAVAAMTSAIGEVRRDATFLGKRIRVALNDFLKEVQKDGALLTPAAQLIVRRVSQTLPQPSIRRRAKSCASTT